MYVYMRGDIMDGITFIPLGGAESPGDSCYYLEVDGLSFIFDCGANVTPHNTLIPVFSAIPRGKKIEAIFLSHVHLDHIAGFKYIPGYLRNVPIISTPVNKRLFWEVMHYILEDFNPLECDAIRLIANSILPFPYFKTEDFGKFKVTLYEAGHTPGASMFLIETENHKILYTGDHSCEASEITNPYLLPENLKCDIVIDCANSLLREENNDFTQHYMARLNNSFLMKDGILNFSANQPIKAVELLALLGAERDIFSPDATIRVTKRLAPFAECFADCGFNVIPANTVFEDLDKPDFTENNIYFHLGPAPKKWMINCESLDYYLHDSRQQELEFIDKYAEKYVFLTHLSGGYHNQMQTEEYNDKTLFYCRKGRKIHIDEDGGVNL